MPRMATSEISEISEMSGADFGKTRGTARVVAALQRGLCVALSAMAMSFVPLRAPHAELVSTGAVVDAAAGASVMEAGVARTELSALLSREDMRQQLESLGVSADQARARVAALTDAEVLRVHGKIAEVPAGGATFIAVVAGIFVVTITGLLITDLLGYTDVFSFINPIQR
jgi:hypothetical protein